MAYRYYGEVSRWWRGLERVRLQLESNKNFNWIHIGIFNDGNKLGTPKKPKIDELDMASD